MPQGFAPRKQSSENDSCCSVPYYGPVPQEERHLFFPQKQMSAPETTRFCVSTDCKTHALLYNSALPAEGTVSGCTHDGVVVQLVRISACHVEGRGFESRPLRQNSIPLIVRSAGFSFSAGSAGPLRLSISGRDVIIPLPAAVLLNLFSLSKPRFLRPQKSTVFSGLFLFVHIFMRFFRCCMDFFIKRGLI